MLGLFLTATAPAAPEASGGTHIAWQERFAGDKLDWVAVAGESAEKIASIYKVKHDATDSYLNAHHDYRAKGAIKPIHYGRAFKDDPIPLDRIRALRWRWRVNQHPAVTSDPWVDIAASLYVVIKEPSFWSKGRGFKFAWLAKPGARGTFQSGLLQVALRSDPVVGEWRTEEVDLCALYRKHYGTCEGESLRYVGVTTDADGTASVADGDYADFQVVVDGPQWPAASH